MAYLVELRHPKGAVWLSDCWPKTRKKADARAREIERGGWFVRITRTAPEPSVDHTTGNLRERGDDVVVYVSPGNEEGER